MGKLVYSSKFIKVYEQTTLNKVAYVVINENEWIPTRKNFKTLTSAIKYAKKLEETF